MAKSKKGKNPWTGEEYDIKDCPDCEQEAGTLDTVKSIVNYMNSESKIMSEKRYAI